MMSLKNPKNYYVFDETEKSLQSVNLISNIACFVFYSSEISCKRRYRFAQQKILSQILTERKLLYYFTQIGVVTVKTLCLNGTKLVVKSLLWTG